MAEITKPSEANIIRVSVCDGKYTVIQGASGSLRALRHGEEWRDLTGDGLVLALAQEVADLRSALAEAESIAKGYVHPPMALYSVQTGVAHEISKQMRGA